MQQFMHIWTTNRIYDLDKVDKKYSFILQQLTENNYTQEKLVELMEKLDQTFIWNSDHHEDKKRELCYKNIGFDFILKEEVKGAIGSAF